MYTQNELIIINILAIAGSVFLFYCLLHAFTELGCNQNRSKLKKYVAFSISFVIAIMGAMSGNNLISMLSFSITSVLLGVYFYNNQKSYVIYYAILCVGVFISDSIATIGFQTVLHYQLISFNRNSYYLIVEMLLIRFMEFITIQILTFLLKRKTRATINHLQLFTSLLFPMFSFIFLYSLIYLLQVYPGVIQRSLFLFNTILLLVLNIYFTYIFGNLLKSNQLKQELEIEKQHSSLQYRYYERVEQQYQESRKVIHDIRNHIQAVDRLVALRDSETISQYTTDMQEMLNQLGMTYFTSVKVLNIILNDKTMTMTSLGIKSDITLRDISLDFMRDIDITTVFSNLLDNAIEAAKDSKEKWIYFHADRTHDFISITLKNSFLTTPKKSNTLFHSTKQNHDGYGLKNVERVLLKYNSDIQYQILDENDAKIFSVSLLLMPT
ncbi:MAG: sensor histidine kinase [Lachnotalea sp.]